MNTFFSKFKQANAWAKFFYLVAGLVVIYFAIGIAPLIVGGAFCFWAWKWVERKSFPNDRANAFKAGLIIIFVLSGFTGVGWARSYFSPPASEPPKTEVSEAEVDVVASEEDTTPILPETQAPVDAVNQDAPEELDDVVTNLDEAKSALQTVENENLEYFAVTEVVDGDTIKVASVGTLRLIGIDTPETKHPSKPVQCFGREASAYLKTLIEGKRVAVEFDDSQGKLDKYGRVLAYVRGEDGVFVNKEMIRQGYAHEYTYSTPYKYQEEFKAAEQEARDAGRGLWNSETCAGDTDQAADATNEAPVMTDTIPPAVEPVPIVPAGTPSKYTCDCSKACTKITSCEEANFQLNQCGCSARDGDDDGVPCEALCK